jgi:hypothetical protein
MRSVSIPLALSVIAAACAIAILCAFGGRNAPTPSKTEDVVLKFVAYEYGRPDPKNATVTLQWLGGERHEVSVGQYVPGTSLRFYGIYSARALLSDAGQGDGTYIVLIESKTDKRWPIRIATSASFLRSAIAPFR